MSMSVLIRIILIIILIVVVVMIRRKRQEAAGLRPKAPAKAAKPGAAAAQKPRPQKPERPPEEVYLGLRKQALATGPERLGLAGAVGERQAYGGVMEMGLTSTVVTLVCLANGDASLLYKTGGGMVGGGDHDNIRRAAKAFVDRLQRSLPLMNPTQEQPLPEPDRVRFYALTPRGILTVEKDREELGGLERTGGPPLDMELSALMRCGQEVVTQMRQIQEQRAG